MLPRRSKGGTDRAYPERMAKDHAAGSNSSERSVPGTVTRAKLKGMRKGHDVGKDLSLRDLRQRRWPKGATAATRTTTAGGSAAQ